MKTKLELAHEYAMLFIKERKDFAFAPNTVAFNSFEYADAMYAELEKRESKEKEEKRNKLKELLNSQNTFFEREGQHFEDVKEWQPDWSKAPEWAKWWAMDKDGESYFYSYKPYVSDDRCFWSDADFIYVDGQADLFKSHGYTGDWRDSLRERP